MIKAQICQIQKSIYVLILLMVVCMLLLPHRTQAEGRESLTISPLRNELKLIPGQQYEASVKLENSGEADLEAAIYASSFSIKNENYDQEFNQLNSPSSVNNWVKFSQNTIFLPAKSKQSIKYIVSVPANAEPGGHYAAIFAQTKSQNQKKTDVIEVKRVASLVNMEVAGDIVRTGKIESLQSNLWQNNHQILSQLRLYNDGNTHYRVDGYQRLKNLLGRELGSVRLSGLLLPQTTRLFESNIDAPDWPGIYKLESTVSFPNSGWQSKTNWIIYFPNQYIVITGLLLLGLTIYYFWHHLYMSKTKN